MNKTTKIWLLALLKILLKKGKKLKYINYLKFICFSIKKEFGDLNSFFDNFHENLYFPFYFRIRAVAGRKVLIPAILNSDKEIFYICKYIKNSIKGRSEKYFKNKFFNELKDIYLNKNTSLTKKKIEQYYNDLQVNFVNLRFIRVFKK